eukprot:2225745-Amphidinium_carterae.1
MKKEERCQNDCTHGKIFRKSSINYTEIYIPASDWSSRRSELTSDCMHNIVHAHTGTDFEITV